MVSDILSVAKIHIQSIKEIFYASYEINFTMIMFMAWTIENLSETIIAIARDA